MRNLKAKKNNFQRNVKAIREKQGLTRRQLATLIKMVDAELSPNAQVVISWESGRRKRVQLNTLIAISTVFGVTLDELVYS